MQTFINQAGWYDLLTLDHKVCRMCFAKRGGPNHPGGAQYIRALAKAEGRPLSDTNLAAYRTSLRAWFKRHVAAEHPEWMDNIRWTKEANRGR